MCCPSRFSKNRNNLIEPAYPVAPDLGADIRRRVSQNVYDFSESGNKSEGEAIHIIPFQFPLYKPG